MIEITVTLSPFLIVFTSGPTSTTSPEARNYRYTVVNGRTVIVEPQTRRIIQVIE